MDSLPWVRSSSVAIRWPSTVKITVVERTPVAVVAALGGVGLVDETGRVLTIAKTAPPGLMPVQLVSGTKVIAGGTLENGAVGAMQVVSTLPPAFVGQVASVVVNSDGTITLHLTTPVTVNLGTPTELNQKYNDIASVIAGATLHPGDVIDVSVPQASTITGP